MPCAAKAQVVLPAAPHRRAPGLSPPRPPVRPRLPSTSPVSLVPDHHLSAVSVDLQGGSGPGCCHCQRSKQRTRQAPQASERDLLLSFFLSTRETQKGRRPRVRSFLTSRSLSTPSPSPSPSTRYVLYLGAWPPAFRSPLSARSRAAAAAGGIASPSTCGVEKGQREQCTRRISRISPSVSPQARSGTNQRPEKPTTEKSTNTARALLGYDRPTLLTAKLCLTAPGGPEKVGSRTSKLLGKNSLQACTCNEPASSHHTDTPRSLRRSAEERVGVPLEDKTELSYAPPPPPSPSSTPPGPGPGQGQPPLAASHRTPPPHPSRSCCCCSSLSRGVPALDFYAAGFGSLAHPPPRA